MLLYSSLKQCKIVSGSKGLHISGEVEGSTTWPAGSAHPWKPCAFPTRHARDTHPVAVWLGPPPYSRPRANSSVPPVGSRQVCVWGDDRQSVFVVVHAYAFSVPFWPAPLLPTYYRGALFFFNHTGTCLRLRYYYVGIQHLWPVNTPAATQRQHRFRVSVWSLCSLCIMLSDLTAPFFLLFCFLASSPPT